METKHLFDGIINGGELSRVRCRVRGSFGRWEADTKFAPEGYKIGGWFGLVSGEV